MNGSRRLGWVSRRLAALLILIGTAACADPTTNVSTCDLPVEGRTTLTLIRHGGPFPYAKDGSTFRNFERRLAPRNPRYYREYTVPTPGLRHRGARRIVAGEGSGRDVRTSEEYYYTDDHYQSFRRIHEFTSCPTKSP